MKFRDDLFRGIWPTAAAEWPAARWVPEFLFVEREIPCADRFVPIERDLVRLRKRRASSLEAQRRRKEREAERERRKAQTRARQAARKAELDASKVRCPGCNRLVYPDKPCATCARLAREAQARETARCMSLPVTGVIVVLADGREVSLSPGDYSFFSNEAYARRIDERHWIALRLGLLAA